MSVARADGTRPENRLAPSASPISIRFIVLAPDETVNRRDVARNDIRSIARHGPLQLPKFADHSIEKFSSAACRAVDGPISAGKNRKTIFQKSRQIRTNRARAV